MSAHVSGYVWGCVYRNLSAILSYFTTSRSKSKSLLKKWVVHYYHFPPPAELFKKGKWNIQQRCDNLINTFSWKKKLVNLHTYIGKIEEYWVRSLWSGGQLRQHCRTVLLRCSGRTLLGLPGCPVCSSLKFTGNSMAHHWFVRYGDVDGIVVFRVMEFAKVESTFVKKCLVILQPQIQETFSV